MRRKVPNEKSEIYWQTYFFLIISGPLPLCEVCSSGLRCLWVCCLNTSHPHFISERIFFSARVPRFQEDLSLVLKMSGRVSHNQNQFKAFGVQAIRVGNPGSADQCCSHRIFWKGSPSSSQKLSLSLSSTSRPSATCLRKHAVTKYDCIHES